jgi:integrase
LSTWLRLDYKPALKQARLPYVKPHALRHAFNKMIQDYGVPPREAMQIMGHSSKKMTFETYDRESVQRLVQVTRNLRIVG